MLDPVLHRQGRGERVGVELGEHAHGLGVALGPRGAPLDHRLAAEILEDQQALGEVLAVDFGRREAERPQPRSRATKAWTLSARCTIAL